jgi:hypothetical protein
VINHAHIVSVSVTFFEKVGMKLNVSYFPPSCSSPTQDWATLRYRLADNSLEGARNGLKPICLFLI